MERWIQTHGRPFGSEFMLMDRLQVLNLWWALGESLNRTVLVGSLHFKFQTYKRCEHRSGRWFMESQRGRGSESAEASGRTQVVAGSRDVDGASWEGAPARPLMAGRWEGHEARPRCLAQMSGW